MKKTLLMALAANFLLFFSAANAQQWLSGIPQEKSGSGDLSFYEIQKAFEDYWAPFNVQNGYYYVGDEKIKAGGWKQFRRWEWFWNDRVDPVTGIFPKTSAYNEYVRYMLQHPGVKSVNSTTGNWVSMGPGATNGGYAGLGRLNCVAFSPSSPNVIYAGAASGGVWKSTDSGSSWVCMSDNTAVLGISDLVVVPGFQSDIIYAATGDRDSKDNYSVGVLKSADGGLTWNTTGLNWAQSSLKIINRLIGDPGNPDILFAAATDGLYRTADGGVTWTKLVTNVFINIKMKPGKSSVMYGSTSSGGDIYQSVNGGTSWTRVLDTAGSRVELAVSQANPDVVYALISATSNGLLGVFKSVNSGMTFEQVFGSTPNMLAWNCSGSDSGGQGWYDLCIAADPNDANIVFIGGVNTWKSLDGGFTWSISNHWSSTCSGTATVVHADKHYFAFQPGTSTIYECNDGGLYKSSNYGSNWTHLGNGLIISQMYRLGVSQTNSADVITGLQDNGTKSMLNGTWKDVIGGDGMECAIDFSNTNTQYGELYYGSIYRTDNRWSSSTLITRNLTGNAAWVTPFVLDPNNSNMIYVGYQDVWKSTDKGTTWTQLSFWAGSTLRSLAVAPSNSNTIYAATGSILYRTNDGGASWANVTGGLPVSSSNITYIAVKNDDPSTVWVSMGQFNSFCVFQTNDGGVTWTNISAGLPAVPTNCVIQNRQNTSEVELYAGTDIGVFIKLGQNQWVPFNTGLPNVVVMELEIYYSADPAASRLRAATYGRGLWESDLYSGTAVQNQPPVFNADPILEANGKVGSAYNSSIKEKASDPDASDVLSFTKVNGPAWLTVTALGGLTGTPGAGDAGLNLFNVKVSDGKGGSDQAVLQIQVSETVVVIPPIADFTANAITIFEGQTVQFTDLSQNNPTGWTWDFGDNTTSVLQNPTKLFSTAGSYTITLKAENSAGSNTAVKSGYITVTVRPEATYCQPTGINNLNDYISSVSIGSQNSNTGQGMQGYQFYTVPEFSVTSGQTYTIYLVPFRPTVKNFWKVWIDYNMDGDFLDAGESVFTAVNRKGTAKGSIVIAAGAAGRTRMRIAMRSGGNVNPCDNGFSGEVEDYLIDIKTTGRIEDEGGSSTMLSGMPLQLSVYPNPATMVLNVETGNTDGSEILHVYNMLGSQMEQLRMEGNLVTLDLSRYPRGVYYIQLVGGNRRAIQKFIKE